MAPVTWKALFAVLAVSVMRRLAVSMLTDLANTPGSPASILVSSAERMLFQLSLAVALTLYLRLSICTEYTSPAATA